MVTSHQADVRAGAAVNAEDLGPLAWVLDETRKTIETVSKSLKRFAHDAQAARGVDIGAVDASQLRLARQQLHQVSGALDMVGYPMAARVVRAMESAVQQMVQHPEKCTEEVASTLERAGFAVVEYLESQLSGRGRLTLGLFPQYRQAQEIAGAERIHPADLWIYDWRWADPQVPAAPPLVYEAQARQQFDRRVLRIMRIGDPDAGTKLALESLGLAAGEAAGSQAAMFWKLAAGFFEALGQSLVPVDIYVKRTASRVLMQYTALARGEKEVPERLALDMLFFCAQAKKASSVATPALVAVRKAWGLEQYHPIDYEQPAFGLYDPAVLTQARRRVDAIKEHWSALSGGDMARLHPCVSQFGLVIDSLDKLHAKGKPLSGALGRVAAQLEQTARPPSPELAMETATAILFLEASFADFHPADALFTSRMQQLAERLDSVRGGAHAPALEAWMEELYRSVSDRQTMGTVVGELRTTLGEIEQHLDQFFRNPTDKSALTTVPARMAQMRGVLSVLGLEQAAQAVGYLSDTVDAMIATEVDPERIKQSGTFDRLGNSLGALGFQIDMMGYQPMLARKLFVYDAQAREFRYVSGRAAGGAPFGGADDEADAESSDEPGAAAGGGGAPSAFDDGGLALEFAPPPDAVPTQPAIIEETLAWEAAASSSAPAASDAQAPAPAPAPAAPPPAAVEVDGELLDIFIEEAREVFQTGRGALAALGEAPDDLDQKTTLRRSFHTLKGSSRMVGLAEFGEAAWAMEQVLNTWLAEQKPVNDELRQLAAESFDGFERWADAIAANRAQGWSAAAFREAADTMRTQGQRLPLADMLLATEGAPAAAAAPPEPEAEPEPEPEPAATAAESVEIDDIELAAPPPPSAEAAALAQPLAAIELPDLELTAPPPDAAQPAPEAPDLSSKIEFDLGAVDEVISLDAPAAADESAPPADVPPPPGVEALEVHELSLDDFDFPDSMQRPPAAAGDLAAQPQAAAGLPAALEPVAAEPPPEQPEPAREDDELYKQIGDLRISAPLYNVYLNEADEWSRQLGTELSEWALELDRPVPERATARAHSLAGASATVGFKALSDLARAVEHALLRLEGQTRGAPEQARALSAAADEISRVLHQFAAGMFKRPDADVLADVQALEPLQTPPADSAPAPVALAADHAPASLEPVLVAAFMPPEPTPPTPPEPVPPAQLAPPAQSTTQSTPPDTLMAALPVFRPPVARDEAPPAPPARQALGDDIDLVDAVDPDLFPIFEEEAQELLPRMSGALRQWVAHPDDRAARADVMRALHTLKGSARLAGALRLGEIAHRTESAIELIGAENIRTEDLEPLLEHLDEIEELFGKLQSGVSGLADTGAEQPHVTTVQAALEPVKPAARSKARAAARAEPPPPAPATDAAPAEPPAPAIERGEVAQPAALSLVTARAAASQAVRVRSQLLDRMVAQAGEVITSRARLEAEVGQLRTSLGDLTGNLDRLRQQLRDVELQAETQMQSRMAQSKDTRQNFDPLEFDRFTRMQELTRMMAESVNDVATVQRSLQRAVDASEDDLAAQARQSRELQRDLLRTRMVEFESISERLYRVVRQASKETGKQVRLDIVGGSIEMDRGILERMTPAFEHLLRNGVVHGVEAQKERTKLGKDPEGVITVEVQQAGNDVSIEFRDDGAGLNVERIRERARQQGLIAQDGDLSEAELAGLVFMAGFTTVTEVTELAGRGVGMDVARTEVQALGGRIEVRTKQGKGTTFRLVLPLTTAVTHVVMIRAGRVSVGVPSNLVEIVQRAHAAELTAAYESGSYRFHGEDLQFQWAGALLQSSPRSTEPLARTNPVIILRSADQRLAMHVDEVLGNQEVVVKSLGPQLSRLPGLAAITALASGAVSLIYNPVALNAVYGPQARALTAEAATQEQRADAPAAPAAAAPHSDIPLVLVVDDSITVRRVTQRLLQREGYRVALANDGLQGLERLQAERPAVVLSDIEMPRMDGFDFVRNIRADKRLHDLPVIMITSRIAEKHREHARELGVDHYLGKPYSEDELLGLVKGYAQAAAPSMAG